jgi:hypothetical protein
MAVAYYSPVTRKLLISFFVENIEYRKRCLYLQEIISLSKTDDIWRQALITFFDTPFKIPRFTGKVSCKN